MKTNKKEVVTYETTFTVDEREAGVIMRALDYCYHRITQHNKGHVSDLPVVNGLRKAFRKENLPTQSPSVRNEKTVKAWGILARNGEIGGGERGQKYVYWDKEEAQKFIDDAGEFTEDWRVVPVTMTYKL